MASAAPDALYGVRNSMFLGNYAQVISDGGSLKADPYRSQQENDGMLAERDALVFKAHIGLGQYDIVINDLANATTPQLKAVRLLAQYMKADTQTDTTTKKTHAESAKQLAKDAEGLPPAAYFQVVITVATILVQDGDLEPALKMLRNAQATAATAQPHVLLELHALVIDILLRINCPNQAENELKAMSGIDDEATITQLSGAWVNLARGGDKVGEAIQLFNDVREKSASVLVLNGLALANMSKGNYEAAEKLLLDAMSKRSSDPETLINLVTCSQHLKKGMDLTQRYISQLRNSYPHHPWVRAYLAMESKFDKIPKETA